MKALRFSDAQKAFILKEMLMGFRWRPFAAANGQHEGALAGPASNQSSDLMLSGHNQRVLVWERSLRRRFDGRTMSARRFETNSGLSLERGGNLNLLVIKLPHNRAMSEHGRPGPANIGSKFWRDRAADMRALSRDSSDEAIKRLLLTMAEDYDAFAAQRDLLSELGCTPG